MGSDQHVTITGQGPSLAAALEELSWRAGFELRAIDAQDEPVSVDIQDLPLWQALDRLLGRRSFLAGTFSAGDGAQRVLWVKVLGPHDRAYQNRGTRHSRSSVESGFRVPPTLFLAAFAPDRDPKERRAALQGIAARIKDNPRERRAFLETDASEIASALRDYPEAPPMLAAMAAGERDSELRGKLQEVLELLGAGKRAGARTGASQIGRR